MKKFEGKTAVITGGASGIGFALAEECAHLGKSSEAGAGSKDLQIDVNNLKP